MSDLTIKRPVSVWFRELQFSPKEFLSSLTKAAVKVSTLDKVGAAEDLIDAVKDISVKDKPAYAAWVLIFRSLQQTLAELVADYDQFFDAKKAEPNLQSLSEQLTASINELEVSFDISFFDEPHNLPLLDDLQPALTRWLTGLGMSEQEAAAFHARIKSRFVLALHKQWLDNKAEFACIEEALSSPFFRATRDKRRWMQYNAWLQECVDERLFDEAFSLRQVFVPLRAYYEQKPDTEADEEFSDTARTTKDKKIVVKLQQELTDWVLNFDADSAVRVISSGPGSGKSSFAKMFAAHIAKKIEAVPVLFVPLHHFDPSEDLTSAIEKFVVDVRYLTGSPLDATDGQDRLLIIFDGLDELAMQGKAVAETAVYFVNEVVTKIQRFNAQGLKRQVLITGRDLAIQSVEHRLRAPKQILHVLPYFLTDEEQADYIDEDQLLKEDQRDLWWQHYGQAKGIPYNGLPVQLSLDRLDPITREPLLNYLVALSFERDKITFSENTTLNTIYQDLLEAVYERQWDHGPHKGAQNLDLKDFVRILEEIALAVWQSDGRTATLDQIYNQCERNSLTKNLDQFQEGAKKGFSRLLAAFYFRQNTKVTNKEKKFEFTHKSFGEYLTAKRIVHAIKHINEKPDNRFDEHAALIDWGKICGPTAIDPYLFRFLFDEISVYPDDELADWQKISARLLGHVVRNGSPMEEMGIPKFREMMHRSHNLEKALLVVHYACAIRTQKVIVINWGNNETAFGDWLGRIQGQREGLRNNNQGLDQLAYLPLKQANLSAHDLIQANLLGADLRRADLRRANLEGSNLESANLEGADLRGADLRGANLWEANLRGADLWGTDLRRADLLKANLRGADLRETDLRGADLRGVDLRGVDLREAKLEGALLEQEV